MGSTSKLNDIDPNYLLHQLNTARREINNLRQQVKSFKYIFDKDVNEIKSLIGLQSTSNGSDESTSHQDISSSSSQLNNFNFNPIGVISSGFPKKRGTPRQAGICMESKGKITLFNSVLTNPEHALSGLEEFSHMWILFYFHKNESNHVRAKVAPPRLNGARVGVFSTRSPHRPCPIGLSLVKILKIQDNTILFEGVDTIDGTPVLDIKPYIPQYDNPVNVEMLIRRGNTPEDDLLASNAVNFDTIGNESSSDVSRDEEIALRLQAEEFDQNVPMNNLATGRLLDSTSINERRIDNENDLTDEITSIMESSRFLDGADGSSAVHNIDMDLLNHQTFNSRLNNSPIRMGIREAPDGEEGFESPTLRPSRTISNIQSISNSNNNLNLNIDDNNQETEIRIPDWINQPESQSLVVMFNDRALNQLNEIVNDKVEEQKCAIVNVLREDPRSVYLRQRWANQFYTFLIHDLHISCRFDDNRGIVTVFQIRHAGRTCQCGLPEWQCLGHSSPNN